MKPVQFKKLITNNPKELESYLRQGWVIINEYELLDGRILYGLKK